MGIIKITEEEIVMDFEVESGKIVVSDPCYDVPSFSIEAKEGTWIADYEKDGVRIKELRATYSGVLVHNLDWEDKATIGVDSGQAGIFDKNIFRNDDVVDEEPDFWSGYKEHSKSIGGEYWYASCVDIALSEESAGTLKGGAVSSSGYGDGGYEVDVAYKDGKAVGVRIIFIPDSECVECGHVSDIELDECEVCYDYVEDKCWGCSE